MAAKLTPDQVKLAIAWLHDVSVGAGLPVKQMRDSDYKLMYVYSTVRANSKTLMDEFYKHQVDYKSFETMDKALMGLEPYWFCADLPSIGSGYDNDVRKKASVLARYLAGFCAAKKLYWDDTYVSSYEFDECKNTIIGKALFDFECFTSQVIAKNNKANKATAKKTSAKVTGLTSPTTSNTNVVNTNGPKIGYKASGAHSADIPNLLSTPGQKETLSGDVYSIIADKIGKNTPMVYITPLKVNTNGILTISKSAAEKVNLGSGNGYTDCACWFDDYQEASNFLAQILGSGNTQFAKYNNIHIVRAKADSNGYYKVSTEYGPCFIKASKLNEELEEALDNQEMQENHLNIPLDWKKYAEELHKYDF